MPLKLPPDLARLQDHALQQTMRRLWEQLTDLDDRITSAELALSNAQSDIDQLPEMDDQVRKIAALVRLQASTGGLGAGAGPAGGGVTPPPVGPTPLPPSVPTPPGTGLPRPPSQLSVVQAVDAANPGLIDQSCLADPGGNYGFLDALVTELRLSDPRWGYNGKRGDVTDISEDVVDYYWGADLSLAQGSSNVYIYDVIQGHCGPTPAPAWIDQTDATAALGEVGAWVFPRP